MKKQILFLAIFTLALIFAGTNEVYAQPYAQNGSAPKGTDCVDDALHPMAGKRYPYDVIGTFPTGNTANTFRWWATKDETFITLDTDGETRIYNYSTPANVLTVANGDLIYTTPAVYNVPTADQDNIEIAWSDAILSATSYHGDPATGTPTFLAVHVIGDCNDNIKVYELDPIIAFTVDVTNWESDGTAALGFDVEESQCIDNVSSAIYNTGTYLMEYEYGENVFIYEVIAANFTDWYIPELVLSGLGTTQTATIEWTYDSPDTWDATTTFVDYDAAPTTHVEVDPADETDDGVSIYVRVTVTNNQFENNAVDNPTGIDIVLTVDGVNSVGQYDVDNGDGTECDQTTIAAADGADLATQVLSPRPAVETHDPTSDYLTPNDHLIEGDEEN